MSSKIFLPATGIMLLSFCASIAQSIDTISYSIIISGNIKGFSKTWKNADGSFENHYQYNDRGRGDSLQINYRQDEQGFPISILASGVDYMKNQVTETFFIDEGVAKWKNNGENGEKKLSGKKFYVGLKSNAGGNLVKALKANNNHIELLPYGDLNLAILQTHTIDSGAAGTRKLWLASISGFSMSPSYVWVDELDETFATVSDWVSTIRKGYEGFAPELLAKQKKAEAAYFRKLALQLREEIKTDLLIKNVKLFDAENAKMIDNADVWIAGGLIKQVSVGKRIMVPGAKIIDGSGKTLIPGLWDMHIHITDDVDGILHVAAGVTHVRDMGNGPELNERIKKINSGEIIGPTVEIKSGFIDGAGPFAAPTGALINNVEEGKEYIRKYAAQGFQQIKFYSSIKPEWVKPLIEEAKKYKLRVCGHIPAFMTATQAIEAGYNEVTHMNMLALNFFGDTVDTRSPYRFSLPAQKTASLDLQGEDMKKFIQLLKSKRITVDPTLTAFEGLFTNRDGKIPAGYTKIIARFPVQMQRSMRAGGGGVPVPAGMDETYLHSFEAFLKITKMLYDNGIRIVAGTDGFPGFDLHRELELYVKAGIPPAKVLQLATYGSALYVGKAASLGSIKAGKKADMVLLEGNPLEDIGAIRNSRLIIKDGILYDAAHLYKALSIQPD